MSYEQRIYDTAIQQGFPEAVAQLVVAQSKHETGNYSSNVFIIDNNAFGYKYVGQKLATKGLSSPEGDYYAHYASVEDSTLELCDWWKRRIVEGKVSSFADISTADDYAAVLKRCGYYGDSLAVYTSALKKWLSGLDLEKEGIAVAIALIVFSFYLFFFK
jgi:hypothetical protein